MMFFLGNVGGGGREEMWPGCKGSECVMARKSKQ